MRENTLAVRFLFAMLLTLPVLGCAQKTSAALPPLGSSDASRMGRGIADSGLIVPILDAEEPPADPSPSRVNPDLPFRPDAGPDFAMPDLPPGLASACDLLKQDCPGKDLACYPIAGAGRCLYAGDIYTSGFCSSDEPSVCARGLACVATSSFGNACLPLCNVANPVCGLGTPCQPLPGIGYVGTCQPG